jgi:thiol-disulfide isomerase/thioredoxin
MKKTNWVFFAVFYLTLIMPAQLYANGSELNSKELSTSDVTVYSEKAQLPLEGLVTLEGSPYNSEALRGRYVLVNLWASWCPDCRREKPSIQRLYMELSSGRLFGNEELVLLTVSLGEEPDTVKSYMNENQYSFPVVLDRENKLRTAYAPRIPTSYILGPDGNIIARIIWEKEWDSEQALGTLRRMVSITAAL